MIEVVAEENSIVCRSCGAASPLPRETPPNRRAGMIASFEDVHGGCPPKPAAPAPVVWSD